MISEEICFSFSFNLFLNYALKIEQNGKNKTNDPFLSKDIHCQIWFMKYLFRFFTKKDFNRLQNVLKFILETGGNFFYGKSQEEKRI